MTEGKKSNKRILLFVGIGCGALLSLCCIGGGVAAMIRQSSLGETATTHAETFLALVQQRNWSGALGASESMFDTSLYSADQLGACLSPTPLGDMTAYDCTDADVAMEGNHANVACTVTSATAGPQEITIGVNSPDGMPYLGFIWFAPGVLTGPEWAGDNCTRWSGREFFEEPPEGRVRPVAAY